jgi:hypothetical protein
MAEHSKSDLELEASCRIAEAGGCNAGNGEGYHLVRRWYGDMADLLPPAKDGTCQAGKLDRLGRKKLKGRGQGLHDGLVRSEVIPGAIVEYVPVGIKGCKANGYGNRDVTMYHEEAFELAEAGIALWIMLTRGTPTDLEMRRIDLSGVLRASLAGELPEGTVKVRDDIRRVKNAKGEVKVYEYKRLRVEWARVAKHAPQLFLDAGFVPFKAELPHGLL